MSARHIQMFILGSLVQGEAHGYQLLARAKMWGVEDWAGFGAGSIYNALGTMEKRGLVVRSGTEKHGGYAPATVYAITDDGRTAFHEMLRKTAAQARAQDPFDLVTAFLGMLSPEERRQLIETRIEALRARLADLEQHREHVRFHVASGKPLDWVLAAMDKGEAFNKAATASAEELLSRSEGWEPPEPLPRAGGPGRSHRLEDHLDDHDRHDTQPRD